jgi:glycosyltransferase involved in cell wall biosynthesis
VVKNNLLHQVNFINNQNSSDVYKQSKIHIMPTITTPDSIEGFGISNVEAASFGLPSIVSSSGGTPESIDQNGYVINENDINELSNKISLTLENYSELSKNSIIFSKNFEKNTKIKEYLNCFND